jgi:hypothetical protein
MSWYQPKIIDFHTSRAKAPMTYYNNLPQPLMFWHGQCKQGINKAKSFKIGTMWKSQHIVGLHM